MSEMTDEHHEERHERLLTDIAAEGSARCCYAPGCISPEAWITSTCDCKYVNPIMQPLHPSSEQTGCAEMRAAFRVLSPHE